MLKGTITADGRLFLPKPLLKSMNITGSTKVLIENIGDELIVRKEESCCRFCFGKDNIITGFPVCRNCAENISDLLKLS